MKTTYKINGLVYGKYWGGGEGAYKATELQGNDLKKLIKEAKSLLKTGGLDSGMGYESLIGALLVVEETETITKDGKEYQRLIFDDLFIGDLTDEQMEFLTDCEYE